MRIDDGLETEQSESRPDVLLDKISILIDFVTGKSQLSQSSSSRARAADHAAAHVIVPDCIADGGSAQKGYELYLIPAAKKDSARFCDLFCERPILCILARLNVREDDVAGLRDLEIRFPVLCASAYVLRCRSDADYRTALRCARQFYECAERVAGCGAGAANEDECARTDYRRHRLGLAGI